MNKQQIPLPTYAEYRASLEKVKRYEKELMKEKIHPFVKWQQNAKLSEYKL